MVFQDRFYCKGSVETVEWTLILEHNYTHDRINMVVSVCSEADWKLRQVIGVVGKSTGTRERKPGTLSAH